jgi:flagellar secretion chaperone FliS
MTLVPVDAARARYLADAVATATPARRIVLLYDRLWLDIQRCQAAQDAGEPSARDHLQHAQQIVAELLGSLDQSAWAGAADLASLYNYLLRELIAESGEPRPGRLALVSKIVSDLRATWQQAAEQLAAGEPAAPAVMRVG